jgi:N-carbamoylputrescine amidase
MSRKSLSVALLQEKDRGSVAANLDAIEAGLREAKANGVQLVLLQELHNGAYFCQHESVDEFDRAEAIPGPSTSASARSRNELGVVLVASLVRAPRGRAVSQHRGGLRTRRRSPGKYRKMHIPDDPGFYEKFYFTPGDLGFTPIDTSVGRSACWCAGTSGIRKRRA